MPSPQIASLIPQGYSLSQFLSWPPSQPLPTSAGVYLFYESAKNTSGVALDESPEVDGKRPPLYVGKAKNLKNRVKSYVLKTNLVGKTKLLIDQVKTFRYITLDSDLQAILLEANLIKTFTPKYNLRSRDDKSPLYIIITKETYPRVLILRKPQVTKPYTLYPIHSFFGPFSSASETYHLLTRLRHIFPFCNATPLQKKNRQTCFYYHLGLCLGTCKGIEDKKVYRHRINELGKFLDGKQQLVVKSLTKSMNKHAKLHAFEEAAKIKKQLEQIEYLNQRQQVHEFQDEINTLTTKYTGLAEIQILLNLPHIPARIECYDIANIQGQFATGSMVVLQNGQPTPSTYRHFQIHYPKNLSGPNDPGMIAEVISRRLKHPEWPYPDLIVVDGGKAQVSAALSVTRRSRPELVERDPLTTNHFPVIGLAKRDERIIFGNKEIHLPRHSPALQLLQRLRDESHRFARRLHHRYTKEALLKS